jgi:hypothetical protein
MQKDLHEDWVYEIPDKVMVLIRKRGRGRKGMGSNNAMSNGPSLFRIASNRSLSQM